MKSWIIGTCILLSLSTYGRIGETLDQCTKRYGSPQKRSESWYTFNMGPYYIEAGIGPDKKVSTLLIQRSFNGKPVAMNAAEVKQILNANAVGGYWFEADKTSSSQNWRIERDQMAGNEFSKTYHWRVRGSASAIYNTVSGILLIRMDPERPFPQEADRF